MSYVDQKIRVRGKPTSLGNVIYVGVLAIAAAFLIYHRISLARNAAQFETSPGCYNNVANGAGDPCTIEPAVIESSTFEHINGAHYAQLSVVLPEGKRQRVDVRGYFSVADGYETKAEVWRGIVTQIWIDHYWWHSSDNPEDKSQSFAGDFILWMVVVFMASPIGLALMIYTAGFILGGFRLRR